MKTFIGDLFGEDIQVHDNVAASEPMMDELVVGNILRAQHLLNRCHHSSNIYLIPQIFANLILGNVEYDPPFVSNAEK